MKKEVMEYVIEVVREITNSKIEMNKNTSLYNDAGMDSLDAIELITKLEEKYKVAIPDTEISNVTTIGEVVEVISKYLK